MEWPETVTLTKAAKKKVEEAGAMPQMANWPEDEKFTAWYVKGGQVKAALTVGRSDDLSVASELLRSGESVADKRSFIEDPDSDLASLSSAG